MLYIFFIYMFQFYFYIIFISIYIFMYFLIEIFLMSKSEFRALPKWKRDAKKKELQLF